MKPLITRIALWWVNRMLMRDSGYYEGWKANIAMAVYDEIKRKHPKADNAIPDIHKLCNSGADRFLALLRAN